MSHTTIALLCKQLSLLLKSGIPLHQGVEILIETATKETKSQLIVLQEQLEHNQPLDQALKESNLLPPYSLYIVQIGLKTGHLEETFIALSMYYERIALLKKNLRTAILYPFILSSMMLGIMLILTFKVMPLFEKVFKSLGSDRAYAASHALTLGKSIGFLGLLLMGFIIILFVLGLSLSKIKSTSNFLNTLWMHTKISKYFALTTFLTKLSLLLRSGLPLEGAFSEILPTVWHMGLKKQLQQTIDLLNQGTSIPNMLHETHLLSPLATQKICIAMHTGYLTESIEEVKNDYEEALEERLNKLITLIESGMITLLALIIGAMLISVMIPLIGIMSSIGTV